MKRSTPLMLALVLLVAWPLSAGQRRARWWQSEEVRSEIRLTDEQSAQIEQCYSDGVDDTLRRIERACQSMDAADFRALDGVIGGIREEIREIQRRCRGDGTCVVELRSCSSLSDRHVDDDQDEPELAPCRCARRARWVRKEESTLTAGQ